MTSRYRAGQRVAAIISELQDQGLSTSEIALELQQRGVLMRGAAADPVADLCDNVRDIVADFAAAVGQPADEVTALRARAEAAEQRAEAAERELAQARAKGEAAGRAAERERVLALVRAAYTAAREVERRCEVLDPSAASGALDVLEQRIESGEHVGGGG